MRHPILAKTLAVTATVLLLGLALARIGFLVDERQSYQAQAVQSVQQSHAGAQTLLGPLLQRTLLEPGEASAAFVSRAGWSSLMLADALIRVDPR